MNPRTLTIENEPEVAAPTAAAVAAAVARMTPHGGPSFLILEGESGDYVQAAGGLGEFTVEWRAHGSGADFTHWKAGRSGSMTGEEVAIALNGHSLRVRTNERLGLADVVAICGAFLAGEPRPPGYAWRDITAMFA